MKGMAGECIAANVARLRLDRELTQEGLARKAGVSRVALGKIERGDVVPRARTLGVLAKALEVPVGELVTPVRPLGSVRFRARTRVHAREQILAEVSKWLDAYSGLEADLDAYRPFKFELPPGCSRDPIEAAQTARHAVGFGSEEPVRDICGLLEENGVKLLLLETKRDSFFGLSVGIGDGGPAVVVNTWDRISVERWIFTAAHELGHVLLHPSEYQREATELPMQAEREADEFASEFLMPEAAFAAEWEHDARTLTAGARPQGQENLPRELQDRALSAGGVRARDIRGLACISASASRSLRQDAPEDRRAGRSSHE